MVVYRALPTAFRESFRAEGYPVEAFGHDPETLEYVYLEVDGPSGVPALMNMVTEGIEIPEPSDMSRSLKARASEVIAMGPPPLDAASEQRQRYGLTDLIDDLRDVRSREEQIATAAALYQQLADYHLRRQGLWSASRKAIPRALNRVDPQLCQRYCQSFAALFELGDARAVIALTEELLQAGGGLLFEGYRVEAPTWRKRG